MNKSGMPKAKPEKAVEDPKAILAQSLSKMGLSKKKPGLLKK